MKIKYIIVTLLTLSLGIGHSQDRKKDTIDNQVVNVIKPYTPTISDAFKVRDTPSLTDSNSVKKKNVKYTIFSIPVASTFTPAKGKAASVDKAKQVKLYDNYASLGLGTYTTFLGEVYLNHELSNSENVGGYFSHHSSLGGIEGILLDDDFSTTRLNAKYSQNLRDFSWKVDAGFDLMTYNWYGLSDTVLDESISGNIDPGHAFTSFYVGGKLKFEDVFIKDGSIKFRRFSDNQDSGENRFMAHAGFDIPIQDEIITATFKIDYINGSFDRNFVGTESIDFGNTIVGLAPTYRLTQDDLTVDLGLNLVYLNDTEFNNNQFFVYPNIEASYRLVDEILIAFGGIKGDLIQNSYHDFANENSFVSPTLLIRPTDQSYRGFFGVRGKLSHNVSYNVSGNYAAANDKVLFKANEVQTFASEDYQYGNSFGVVYDDIKTFSISGELNMDINRNFSLTIKGEYFNYNLDEQGEAWNLPDIKGSVFLDYQISEEWFAGASAFFVGERKDQEIVVGTLIPQEPQTITLKSYFDLNAHLGYRINSQLSFFTKVNNITNQDYQRWLNFPVQGIQFVAGATYQFDF